MRFESEAESLKRRLAEAKENLRLIRERKSEFVQQTNIPLELIKDERRLEHEIKALQAQLAQLPPPQEGMPPVSTRPRAWMIVAGVVGLVLVLVVGLGVFPPLAFTPAPTPTPSPPAATSPTPPLPASPTPTLSLPSPAPLLQQVGEPLYPGCNVRAISLTPSGVLVALDTCEEEGVRRVGGAGRGADPGNPDSLLMAPLAVAEGPDGRLWVGTAGNGLIELTPDGTGTVTVTGVHTRTADEANMAVVGAVASDGEGGIWVGVGWEPGLHLLDAGGQWHTPPWENECFAVYDIELDERGQVWLATFGGGVRCLDPATYTTTAVYKQQTCPGCLPSDYVRAIVAVDGRKWIGTDDGLAVLDDQGDQPVWRVIDGLPYSKVVALADDGAGHIFVGTEGPEKGGLAIVDDEELSVTEVLTFSHSIGALAFDPKQNRLWVGTLGNGLSVWAVKENNGQTSW